MIIFNTISSLVSALIYKIPEFKIAITLILATIFINTDILCGQSVDLILQEALSGSAEFTATNSITLKAGFSTYPGTTFKASITNAQGIGASVIITPSTSGTAVSAGSSALNFIKAITYREARTSEPASNVSFMFNEDIEYFDGLGRPLQTVQVGAAPNGEDIVVPFFYDNYGREAIKALPYTDTQSGNFRSDATLAKLNNYYYSTLGLQDSVAYNKTVFDNSPLNRPLQLFGPGQDWKDNNKNTTINYFTNETSESGWIVNGNYDYGTISYPASSLYITEIIDEQGNKTLEYKNKQRQVVLKKSYNGSAWLRTAYIYDDHGLLRCIVPPLASGPEDNALCYYYLYDSRNRMIEKRVPGTERTYMVYDNRDRLRCTQNGIQHNTNSWSFIKYDALNRPIVTGIIDNYTGEISSAVNTGDISESWIGTAASANYKGYSSNSFPTNGTIQTATFYDNYSFTTSLSLGDSLTFEKYSDLYGTLSKKDSDPIGRITGTYSTILIGESNSNIKKDLYSASYYDKYGNILRTISVNHLGGKDIVTNKYQDITWLLTQSRQEHYKGSEHITIAQIMEYDHVGRLLDTRQQINNQSEITLNASSYNRIGQQSAKYLHSPQTSGSRSFLQKVDYQYNIRGWLTKINDPALDSESDLFGMQISYNVAESGLNSFTPSQACYNGNISAIRWKSSNDVQRAYVFSYDNLNRLTQARYAEGASLNQGVDSNNENIPEYDDNGNIKRLQRYFGGTLVDNLAYTISPKTNQISSITDATTVDNSSVDDYPGTSSTYSYDKNGNMTTDGSRGTDLSYFETINLPKIVDFKNDARILYYYTPSGAKLLKHVINGGDAYTHYIGNIIYEGGKLSYILTPEGRMVASGEGSSRKFLYEYNLKDHLGNTRVTFREGDNAGTFSLLGVDNYYPFGLIMNHIPFNSNGAYPENKYLYNGKELQNETLNGKFFGMYDYGARFYDPQIGRWHSPDPLQQYDSPYTYVDNNPISNIDPTGMWGEEPHYITKVVTDPTGRIIYWDPNDPDKNIYRSTQFTYQKGESTDRMEIMGIEEPNRNYKVGWYLSMTLGRDGKNHQFISPVNDGPLEEVYPEEDIIEMIYSGGTSKFLKEGLTLGARKIGSGKLKILKKLARYIVNQSSNQKIPGTAKGGKKYTNDGRDGSVVLPKKDSKGNPVTYSEYDINPAPQHGRDRGSERMVIGSDGSAWYTKDHYQSATPFTY
jgi:RHS repeat-associated protein